MIGGFLEVKSELVLSSPMHIGTGEIGYSADLSGPNGLTEISLAACSNDGRPIIPGSSLKGALRSALLKHPDSEKIFGPSNITKAEDAWAGAVTFWLARVTEESVALAKDAPYSSTKVARVNPAASELENMSHGDVGLFLEARTAIDRGVGVAKDKQLFYRQMAPAGTRFAIHLGIDTTRQNTETMLGAILKTLEDGINLGSGGASDQGCIKLDSSKTEITDHEISGSSKSIPAPALAKTQLQSKKPLFEARIALKCDWLFIVNDASADLTRKADDGTPQLLPLRGFGKDADKPRLPGTSLKGVLRTRAFWCAQKSREFGENYKDRPDDVFDNESLSKLSPSQRIFGLTGWRGLLELSDIVCASEKGWKEVSSVKLDRFSGAPYDGGLFTLRASVQPEFSFTLKLMNRPAADLTDDNKAEDLKLIDLLMKDLRANGISLGHGTNRGYGWFSVEELTK